MKKIVLSVIFVTLCVWGYCDYSKSVRRAELAAQTRETLDRLNEIDDNLHGYFKGDTTYFAYNNGETKIYLSNKKYVVKENICDNRMIIYDGKGMCYIGTICLERNKYPSFRTEISFRSKPLVREGYVLDDDDIHEFIRELKRAKAFDSLKVDEFQKQMADAGIYTTTADAKTLDEAPDAYKPMDEIVKLIEPTVDIKFFMKPKMNIKAQEDKVKFF